MRKIMKNILAGIIALTTVFCTFTGCGSTDDEKADSSETSVESTTKIAENTEEDSVSETEDKVNDEKTYEDVVNEYFNAMYSGDSKKLMELQVPDGCTDVLDLKNICIYTEDDDDVGINTSVEDYVKEIIKYYPKGKFVKIEREYDLLESEKESFKESVSGYLILEDYIKSTTHDTFLTLEPHLHSFVGLDALAHSSFKSVLNFKDNKESFAYAKHALDKILFDIK